MAKNYSSILLGKITGFDEQHVYIKAALSNYTLLLKRDVSECLIKLCDGRSISHEQRKKIYALIRDISIYTGYAPEELKELMKYDFIARTGTGMFSLSDVDVTTARAFIDHLIEFCLVFDIPCRDSLISLCEDIRRYLYLCLIHKKCCVCGKKTQLHHVDTVGMGYNRNEIVHIGMKAQPLCWRHHKKCHDIGQKEFDMAYHVFGIEIDEVIAGKYKLKKGD